MQESNDNENSNNENIKINDSGDILRVNYSKRKSVINKNNKPLITQEKYIDNIRRLIMESGIDKMFLKNKLFPQKENEKNKNINNINEKEESKDNNNSNHLQQTNSLREWYQKINLLPKEDFQEIKEIVLDEDEYNKYQNLNWAKNDVNNIIKESKDGKIFYKGLNDQSNSYYIFLNDKYSFNPSVANRKYSCKIKFLSNSNLIGLGIAYKNIVQKNNNKFLDLNEPNFNNGIFALIQTYNPQIKKYCIRPWNCMDKNSVNYVAYFPSFKKGKEIIVSYDTNKEKVEFKIKNNVHIMSNIKLLNNKDKNVIMAPCIVFYHKGEEIKFCEFREDIIINSINNNKNDDEDFDDIDDF